MFRRTFRRLSKSQRQSGQSLLEVVVVTFILLMALVALISLTTVSIARNRLAKERTVATRLAQEGLEWFKYQRDSMGFDQVANLTSGIYCLSSLPENISSLPIGECNDAEDEDWVVVENSPRLFQRNLNISIPPSGDEVQALVEVSWRGDKTVALEGVVKKWER